MNRDVRGVMHWMHNEGACPTSVDNTRFAPDLRFAEPECMSTWHQRAMNLDGAADGIQFHVLTAEQRHDAIADKLIDVAVELLHLLRLQT